jgi:hypothetical protein
MKSILATFIFATAATAASAAPINMISNGSFETGGVKSGAWDVFKSYQGWTVGDMGVEVRNNVAGAAEDGSNFIELDTTANSWISQSVATRDYGATYHLTFWYAPREGTGKDTNGISVLWNDAVIQSMSKDYGNAANPWIKYDFLLTAYAPMSTLKFVATGSSDSLGGSLDNISLVRESAAVPEPATLGMMALGMVALAGIRRRKPSASAA